MKSMRLPSPRSNAYINSTEPDDHIGLSAVTSLTELTDSSPDLDSACRPNIDLSRVHTTKYFFGTSPKAIYGSVPKILAIDSSPKKFSTNPPPNSKNKNKSLLFKLNQKTSKHSKFLREFTERAEKIKTTIQKKIPKQTSPEQAISKNLSALISNK